MPDSPGTDPVGNVRGVSTHDDVRIEHDSMGEIEVPKAALWRAQTQRAVDNFPISGTTLEPRLIHALGQVKAAAAQTNGELEVITEEQSSAIASAAREVAQGRHDEHFPIDVFQTGSGTSSNMNANEVIASIAKANGVEVHPNDHVNMSQSSNDTFPTATHVAATEAAVTSLVPALKHLHAALAGAGGLQRSRAAAFFYPFDDTSGGARCPYRWPRRQSDCSQTIVLASIREFGKLDQNQLVRHEIALRLVDADRAVGQLCHQVALVVALAVWYGLRQRFQPNTRTRGNALIRTVLDPFGQDARICASH